MCEAKQLKGHEPILHAATLDCSRWHYCCGEIIRVSLDVSATSAREPRIKSRSLRDAGNRFEP